MIEECNDATTHKIVSVSENKRTFKINNKSLFTINKVTVDGCYIEEGRKCDYLFEILDNELKEVFYVELKGKHIDDAVTQLEATLRHCFHLHKNIIRSCYIVASRVPKASTSSQNLKREFKRKNSVPLFIDTKQKEVIV